MATTPVTEGGDDRGTPRALMVVNPYSSGLTPKRETSIVHALREVTQLEVVRTARASHAVELARDARSQGFDLIVSCGGDGTANEVLNGMAPAADDASRMPGLAVLPAGGTNVLTRSLGLPNHPLRAVEGLATAIRERRSRTVNVGAIDERLFLFSAGVGLDGELVKRIDERRSGRRPSDLAHLAVIVSIVAVQRFRLQERIAISFPGGSRPTVRASLAVVGNTTPMSYLGHLPLHYMPDCRLEDGLDFIAPGPLSMPQLLRSMLPALGVGRAHRRARALQGLQLHHDVDEFTISCDEPLACQADGEYLGDRTRVQFSSIPRAVRLVH